MFGELPFQSLKVLLLSFSPFSLNNTCKLELSLVCSRGVRGVACCSLGHFQHLWYNLAKTITTLHLIFVVTCAVQCNAVYKMQLKLKCFNYQNLTLFTLDQEYEVKSLCETWLLAAEESEWICFGFLFWFRFGYGYLIFEKWINDKLGYWQQQNQNLIL